MSNCQHQSDISDFESSDHNKVAWLLYGTLGCHLCEMAESLLIQAQMVIDINWQKVDIIDLPEAQMLAYANKIPVLVTPKQTLYYPFSIMDIMALAN